MSRYKIQSDKYTSISETTGTIQNLSSTDSITVTNDTSVDGLVIYPHGHISFSQQIYVKSESRVVEVAVIPFEESGKGGGGRGTTIDAYSVYGNAGAHNSLYREKDLTTYFTSGEMSKAIAAGTFADIFPGDYISIPITVNGTTTTYDIVIGDCDYHLHRGDNVTATHHVLAFTRIHIGNEHMNATDTTAGGYIGSDMWKTILPKYATAIKNAFGSSHILTHRELLSNAESDTVASAAGAGWSGGTTGWEWYSVDVNLFNEPMVYGCRPFSSSGFDIGDCDTQVAAMRHNKSLSFTRTCWCWLRAVVSLSNFAVVRGDTGGNADSGHASIGDGGVRVYFLLK